MRKCMNRRYKVTKIILLCIAIMSITACSNANTINETISSQEQQASQNSQDNFKPEEIEESTTQSESQSEIQSENAQQSVEETISEEFNTYTTKYGKTYDERIPAFQFDYPEGWTITAEDIAEGSEYVALSNANDVVIHYQYIDANNVYGNSRITDEIEVEKVADSNLSLENWEEVDTEIGNIVVAKVYTLSSSQYFPGQERDDEQFYSDANHYDYAIKAESDCGAHTTDGTFSKGIKFRGLLEFAAEIPESITEEEEQEVIKILSSFRVGDAAAQKEINVAEDDPIYKALAQGDYSYFAGTYKSYDSYNVNYGDSISDLVLQGNGIITGGGFSDLNLSNMYPNTKPISVSKQEDGSYLCQVTYNDNASQNYFVIYPKDVACDNPILKNDTPSENNVYIQYFQLDGGVCDMIYYKED